MWSAICFGGEEKVRVIGLAGLLTPAVLQMDPLIAEKLLHDLTGKALADLVKIGVVLSQHEPAGCIAAEPAFLLFQHLSAAMRADADDFVSAHKCVCSFHFFVVRYQTGDHPINAVHEISGGIFAMLHGQQFLLPFRRHGGRLDQIGRAHV